MSKRKIPIRPVIPQGHHLRGISTLVDERGEPIQQWVKTAKTHESREEILARLLRSLPRKVRARPGKIARQGGLGAADLLAVYPMGDPHLGLLSWAPETGADFDLAIAERVLCGAIDALTTHAPRTEKAVIANLGDFFHADDSLNRTKRAGHVLDVDGRRMKILQIGLRVMVYQIDRALEAHDHVHVICLIGNHDDESALFLAIALDAYYRQEPRVRVDLSPAIRRYVKFGRVLLGFTHGHTTRTGRGTRLGAVMAAEQPAWWGETRHRHWLCGHVHHHSRQDLEGASVETFRTLAPRDAWGAGVGYQPQRDMSRIVYHKDFGEHTRTRIGADALEAEYRAR